MSRRIVLFVLSVLSCSSHLIAAPAWGQGFSCGYGLEPGFVSASATGTVHAGHFQSGTVTPLVLFGTTSDLDGRSLTNLQSRTGTMGLTITNLLNPTHEGSLAHYFDQMSENTLHLRAGTGGINTTWYQTTNAFNHYINASPCTINHWHTGLVMFVNDVLRVADADPHFDFGPYDTDNDGDVDLVAVIVPEQFGLTCDANGTVISSRRHINYATGDTNANGAPVFVRLVITSDYRVSFPFMVGTLAHEYGHIMDLPELYDRDHQNTGATSPAEDHSAGIGGWGVMARGSNGWEHIERRGGNSARLIDGPKPMSVWSRMQVGWITTANKLVEVTGDMTNVNISDINSAAGRVYRIPIHNRANEYFLLSNRQAGGARGSYYDRYAPASGLAIWHIDESASPGNDANRFEEHKRVDLECTDRLFERDSANDRSATENSVLGGDNLDYWSDDDAYRTRNGGNLGDANDLWTTGAFTPTSNPSSMAYNGNNQNVFTGIAVRNITQNANGSVRVNIRFIPNAPTVSGDPMQGTGDDWNQVMLSFTAPDVNTVVISGYQYSINNGASWNPNPNSNSPWSSAPTPGAGMRTGTILLPTDDNTVNYTFQVRAVTANYEQGEAAAWSSFTLDRPGTVALSDLTTPKVGDQLTATLTDANGGISGQRWQWERGTVSGDVWTGVPIANAPDAPSYMLTLDDVGQQVRATVSYMDGAGDNTDMAASDPTAVVVAGVAGLTMVEVAEVVLPATAAREVATYTASAPTGTTIGWSLAGPDKDAFTLSAAGVLAFAQGPDYEAPTDAGHATDPDGNNIYHVTVQATVGEQTGTAEVQVTVTNADDLGTVALTPASPRLDHPLTAQLTDPDGGITGASWTWEREGDTPNTWIVVWPTGVSGAVEGAELSSYTPQAEDVGHRLQARVDYRDGHSPGTTSDKTAVSDPSPAVVGVLPPPTGLTVRRSTEGVALAWIAPAPGPYHLERYEYRHSTDGGATYPPDWTPIFYSKATLHTVEGLSLLLSYTFEVRAVYTEGASAPSEPATVVAIVGTLSPPTGLTAHRTVEGATLQWTAPAGDVQRLEHYEYRQSTDGGTTWQPDWTPMGYAKATLHTVKGLSLLLSYTFEVRAVYTEGASVPSEPATVAGTIEPPEVEATAGDGQVVLRWQRPRAAEGLTITGYEYRYQRVGVTTYPFTWTAVGLTTSQTVEGLTNGTDYLFEVRAVAGSQPGLSRQVSARPQAPPLVVDGPLVIFVAEAVSSDAPVEPLATYTVAAVAADAIAWSLGGVDAAAFSLSAAGVLTVATQPDYEAPADQDHDNVYHLIIEARVGEQTGTRAVTVTVRNADDPGTVTLSSLQPKVGEPLTATLADADGHVQNLRWTWLYWSSGASGSSSEVAGTSSGLTSRFTPRQRLVGGRLQALAQYDDGYDYLLDFHDVSTSSTDAFGQYAAYKELSSSGLLIWRCPPGRLFKNNPMLIPSDGRSLFDARRRILSGPNKGEPASDPSDIMFNDLLSDPFAAAAQTHGPTVTEATSILKDHFTTGTRANSSPTLSSYLAFHNIEITSDSEGAYAEVDVYFIPLPPTGLTASPGGSTSDQVTLRWTTPASNGDEITGYQYSVDGGDNWVGIENSDVTPIGTLTEYIITGLTGTEYTFLVRTVTDGFAPHNVSSWSNAESVTFDRPGPVTLMSSGEPSRDLTNLRVDGVLTATLTDANVSDWAGIAVTWQWQQSNIGADDWIDIGTAVIGEDTNSYTLKYEDLGKEVRATVRYNDRVGRDADMADMAASAPVVFTGLRVEGAVELSVDEVTDSNASGPVDVGVYRYTAPNPNRLADHV